MATVLVRIRSGGGPRWDSGGSRWQQEGEEHLVDEQDLRLWLNHADVVHAIPDTSDAAGSPEAEEPLAEAEAEEPQPKRRRPIARRVTK